MQTIQNETTDCDCIISESDKVDRCISYEQEDGEHHEVLFVEDFVVAHNQLLEKWRDEGFKVFAFGQNWTDNPDRCTGHFLRSDSE